MADDFYVLRRVLSILSGIPEASIHENASIFSFGLDSIPAIQIAGNGHKEGLTLSVADVLQGRTLKGITARMRQGKSTDHVNDALDTPETQHESMSLQEPPITSSSKAKVLTLARIRDEDVAAVLPCSAGQYFHLALWLKSGFTLGEATFAYACQKPLDVDRLLMAWRSLREKHPILRTVFAATSSKKAFQIVLKPSAIRGDAFHCIDLPDCGKNSIRYVLRQEACRHFDLWSPPAELLMIHGCDEDYVVLRLHHGLYDAVTIPRLVDDLINFYQDGELNLKPQDSLENGSMPGFPNIEASQIFWLESLDGCQQTLLQPKLQSPEPISPSFSFAKHSLNGLAELERSC